MSEEIRFAIGEVVKIIAKDRNDSGAICFVEEIIRDPARDKAWGGLYSLYAFEKRAHRALYYSDKDHPSDFYAGDWVGNELETQGRIMTAQELEQYAKERNFVGGFLEDMKFVAAHLGVSDARVRRRGLLT